MNSTPHLNLLRYMHLAITPIPTFHCLWWMTIVKKMCKYWQISTSLLHLFPDQLEPQYCFKLSENTWYVEICAVTMFSCECHHPQSHWPKSQSLECRSLLIQMTLTSLWQLRNTEVYLPPETHKIASKKYDSSLDIFSFGVIVVQMVKNVSRITCSADLDL